MKFFSIMFAVLCVAVSAGAQTNSSVYVPNAADMRIVDGKMYNRALSTNWVSLPSAGAKLEVVDVITGGVVVKSTATASEKMVIKHMPDEKNATKGKTITMSFRAMQVAPVKYGSESVPTFDCGLANTKENRKKLTNGEIKGS